MDESAFLAATKKTEMATAVVSAFIAGIYALVFILLLVVSIGDENRVLNLQAWFSWHVLYLMVLVSDVATIEYTLNARRWHAFVRQVASLVAASQSIGFAVWAIVEWTQTPEESDDKLVFEPRNFFGLAIATLFVQAALAPLIFYTTLGVAQGRRMNNA